ARAIFEDLGAPSQISFTLVNEALALTLLGRADEAVARSRSALAILRELALGDSVIEALS
ncbi:MAG: hypothetical protein GWN07_41265, partial [Actinobacteria bacterium]|nr:hypothetical protein [Actinomycetota bacterium]NIS37444.1 hypothetical protein [Actinomycetota bacterium]NIU66585.1 hypothetical protein [Actinomycetota bacterium]NIW28389.1 hypothetical protein [Actinomycetota bacterium]NIX25906.1 hypothetical protein [Actinomycetota bacterium]